MPEEKTKRDCITSITTGEQLYTDDAIKETLRIIKIEQAKLEHERKKLKVDEKALKKQMGLDKKDVIKDDQTDYFYQVKKSKENNHIILNLSHSARELMFLLIMHMDYMNNVVTINRQYPSNEELQILFKMAKNTFSKSLKELQDNEIVHLERKTKYRIITINPYFVEDTMTTKETWEKFKRRKL